MNNLLELKDLLIKNGKSLGIAALVGAGLAAGGSLLMKNVYTADTKLMVPTSANSSLNGLVASISSGGANPAKNPADLYIGLLRSRSVLDSVIATQDLKKTWGASQDDLRDRLSSATKAYVGKDSLIHVEVTTPNPQEARDLANAMSTALLEGSAKLGITEAGARRVFLEKQLEKVGGELQKAEAELRAVQEKTGIMNLQSNVQADLSASVTLEARIGVKEGQLAALKQSATSSNPVVIEAQAELDALKAKYSQLREPKLNNQSENATEFNRAFRAVKVQEAMQDNLSKLLEQAKVEEARSFAPLQLVDAADVPTNKSGPKRSVITLLGGLTFLLVQLLRIALRQPAGRKEAA